MVRRPLTVVGAAALGLVLGAAGLGAGAGPRQTLTAASTACTERVTSSAGLVEAVRAANETRGSLIICLRPGRYHANLDVTGTAPLTISGGGASLTTIGPITTSSVLTVAEGAHLTLAGLAITGGLSGDPGGLVGTGAGIHTAGDLTLDQVVVAHNGCALTPGPGRPGPAGYGSCATTSVAHHTINAGGIYNTGQLTLVDSSVVANSGFEAGGIMNNHAGVVRLEDGSQVADNGGPGSSDGAGIYNHHDATLLVTDSTVTGNRTEYLDSSGGGIFNQAIGPAWGRVTLVDATITGNSVDHIGGGILNRGFLTVSRSTIADNHAGNNGGGVINIGAMTVTASRLRGNTAGLGSLPFGGGAVYNAAGSTMTMTDALVSGNLARFGSAIDDEAGRATIAGSTIEANGCLAGCAIPSQFGALYNDVGAVVTVTGTTLADNQSLHGGLFDNFGARVTVSSSRITANQGGGAYNQGHPGDPARLQVLDSTISGNTGAGGLLNYGVATLEGDTVSANTSSSGGGGIANAGGSLSLGTTRVADNSAAAGGGGLLNIGGTVVLGTGDQVTGNRPDNCLGLIACPGGL